jgi:endogenous inhibitor of DNA gyrase (YacG/DUF329 family)
MPILSYLHSLFHAETCQTSSQALRWPERPPHCPRCHSLDIGPWSPYHTNTLLHQSQRSLPH